MFPLFKLILKLYIHQSTTVNTVNAVSFPYLQEIFTHATISHTVAIYKHILRIVHFCKLCFLDQVRTATYFWFALNSLYCLLRSCHLRLPVRVRRDLDHLWSKSLQSRGPILVSQKWGVINQAPLLGWLRFVNIYVFLAHFYHIPVTIRFRNVVKVDADGFIELPDIRRAFISFWECSMFS